MSYFEIGGKSYDVIIKSVEESFTVLYSDNTGRTLAEGAEMSLDPLGTFFSYAVTVRRKQGYETEFDDLVDYVSVPRSNGISVRIVHGQSSWSFDAYISSGSRAVQRIDAPANKVYWGEFTMKITPMKAQVLP